MKQSEIRYRIVSALLQAGVPLTLDELVQACGVPVGEACDPLRRLISAGLVVAGSLVPSKPPPQYCWSARWGEAGERRVADAQRTLRAAVGDVAQVGALALDVDSEPSRAFHAYVIDEYHPPRGKRFLVLLQCSVRRPFSTSPSHASMRRAIALSTGYDPRKELQSCPVHVVVLASRIGPVPYDLEDIYPASVRCGGVKHLGKEDYARVKPILAGRMADYIETHGDRYERIATFTQGRYAEVMRAASKEAAVRCGSDIDLAILPRPGGPRVVRIGDSRPRQYWARYWIQLYLKVVSWLGPAQQVQAALRLRALQVEVDGGEENER